MITRIVTHFRPHADELIALIFLRRFKEGEKKFPGVSSAQIEFLASGKLPNGKTAEDFPDTVFLGVGGGIFDEHATTTKERDRGEVCASLVAKCLGIENYPELGPILDIVKSEDLNPAKDKDALSVAIKFLHSCFKEDYKKIYRWAEIAYLAHIDWIRAGHNTEPFTVEATSKILQESKNSEYAWWQEVLDEARKFQDDAYQQALLEFEKAHKETFKASDGGLVDMAVVTSDNEEVGKAFRSKRMQLIVQFNTKGNVAIFTYQKRGLDLSNSVMLLRMAEQVYRWGEIKIKDEKILKGEGVIDGIPWYLFHTKDSAFNGSLTTCDVEPTMIPHDKVVELIKEGLMRRF